jgi:biotin-(acetyl-CoA carboxylase) ligase
LITIGGKVTITTNNNIEISGIAESVDNNGALVVRKQNGEIEHINYGEIV